MTQSERPRRAPQLTLVGPRTPSDEALVRAHLDGDRAAFGALVQRHQRLVLALVRRYARTPDESADLVQQSFLRAFAAAGRVFPRMRLSEEGAFRAWLLRVAVNVGKNHARDGRRWRLEPVEALDLPAAESAGVTERLEAEQRRRLVRAALVVILTKGFKLPVRRGGSTTLKRRNLKRGLEPDRCFWIARASA